MRLIIIKQLKKVAFRVFYPRYVTRIKLMRHEYEKFPFSLHDKVNYSYLFKIQNGWGTISRVIPRVRPFTSPVVLERCHLFRVLPRLQLFQTPPSRRLSDLIGPLWQANPRPRCNRKSIVNNCWHLRCNCQKFFPPSFFQVTFYFIFLFQEQHK